MIFFGVLRKFLDKWCPDADDGLHNELIGGEKEMLSIEPADRIRDMARTALRDPVLVRALRDETMTGVTVAIDRNPIFREQFRDYIEKFGDRCLDETGKPHPARRSAAAAIGGGWRRLEQ
jgi:pyruvate,water dikinase